MRDRLAEVVGRLLDEDERISLVLADIGVAKFEELGINARHPHRVVNVGIREQLMIGVAAGMALEGLRPIVHSYTPFLVERPFEQIKLDLGHQDVGAVLVSIGTSYDSAGSGRTHQAPEDVALLASLPGWHIDVPGHPDEVELLLRHAAACDGRHYLCLGDERNAAAMPITPSKMAVARRHPLRAAVVVAVGPALDPVMKATTDLPVTVLYAATVRPFDGETLRAELGDAADVVLFEPYLIGTSSGVTAKALEDTPHRLLALGVDEPELRKYGTPREHRAAHGLDAPGLATSINRFIRVG
jgi:transketolase